jgi:hypothetical protein
MNALAQMKDLVFELEEKISQYEEALREKERELKR